MAEKLPIEIAAASMKQVITQYVNHLCQEYEIPSIIAVQVLQEIVYESRLNALSSAISQVEQNSTEHRVVDVEVPDILEDEGSDWHLVPDSNESDLSEDDISE